MADRAGPAGSPVLAVGIGGGGDVVGALACAEYFRARGRAARVGGVTWERRPIDPLPGPRRLDEVDGLIERLHPAAALAGPDTTGPGGFRFAESHMARFLGEPVVLIDPNPGPRAVAGGLAAAAQAVGAEEIVLVDVGGDVLGHGDEPGLASPLCDAVLLAAAAHLDGVAVLGAVFGPACDGELTPAEVQERLSEVWAGGGNRGAFGIEGALLDRLEAAVAEIPTEASAQALACARGAHDEHPIRGGRRSVQRTPLGAVTFFFDPAAALRSAARCAAAVLDAASLEHAHELLTALGVRTELAAERSGASRR